MEDVKLTPPPDCEDPKLLDANPAHLGQQCVNIHHVDGQGVLIVKPDGGRLEYEVAACRRCKRKWLAHRAPTYPHECIEARFAAPGYLTTSNGRVIDPGVPEEKFDEAEQLAAYARERRN